jgi:hypothetical protein
MVGSEAPAFAEAELEFLLRSSEKMAAAARAEEELTQTKSA